MDYNKYIELGFKRLDMNDSVEFRQTGYYGFSLEKKIGNKQLIGVSSGCLDKPLLYIPKKGKETYHIIPITDECCLDLCNNYKK